MNGLRDIAERIVRDAMPATDSGHTCFVPRYQIDELSVAVASYQTPSPITSDSGERRDGLPELLESLLRKDLQWVDWVIARDAIIAYGKQCRSVQDATIARLTAELEQYQMAATAEANEVDKRGVQIKELRAELDAAQFTFEVWQNDEPVAEPLRIHVCERRASRGFPQADYTRKDRRHRRRQAMRDGYITIREHKEERNMWAALSFGAGSLFIALVNVWLAYLGVSL